jgi:flagellin-like hook-associated protein FlgL
MIPTSDYPFTDAPSGDSSIVEFVINDEGPEGIPKSINTLWDRWLEIEKQEVTGPKGIKNEKGELLQIEPVGFATMSGLNLLTRSDASTALNKTREEMDSIQSQVYTLAKTFSEIKFESERVESKQQAQEISLGRIQDADVATEYTKLAKNLIVQDVTNKAMIHSRVSAENVFNLLI